MRGLPDEDSRDGVFLLADVEKLVVEGRYGRAELALRRLEALIPGLTQTADTATLLLALYGRALLVRQLGATTQTAIAACDVLERAAHERENPLWVATACATRARFRVDSGDIGGATADLARADAEAATGDLTGDTGYRLMDGLALVYAGLRLNDRADEVRTRIEVSIGSRRVLDQAQHWSTWSGELAARAMEPLAGGAPDPEHELMARAIDLAARLDRLPDDDVPSTLRRGARGVRALSAAYRGRPSEALRLLGPDAFGTVGDLPLVERQIVSLAAMRAHALVGSLATARSLDDAATSSPATLTNLVLEVCRTRERLWLETYAGGDLIPVLHRMTELLVRLGWRGMDLVADTARQALEHQALLTESRTDALTGVGNRRALDEELRQLLRFGPLPLALILVDIDHFKEVNDVFTHVIGDQVLRRVAASLSQQLRTDDQLLRYGGDEFVVLLPSTGDEEADAVAARMRAAVSARPWEELADGLQVSITTGVAAVWSLSGRRPDADAEKLFRRADERLLEGKRNRSGGPRSRSRADEVSAEALSVAAGQSEHQIEDGALPTIPGHDGSGGTGVFGRDEPGSAQTVVIDISSITVDGPPGADAGDPAVGRPVRPVFGFDPDDDPDEGLHDGLLPPITPPSGPGGEGRHGVVAPDGAPRWTRSRREARQARPGRETGYDEAEAAALEVSRGQDEAARARDAREEADAAREAAAREGRERAERADRELAERAEHEQAEQERAEQERRERERAELADRERAEQRREHERAEAEARQRAAVAERAARRETQERAVREAAEAAAREAAELERRRSAERERVERERVERLAREQDERQHRERQRIEAERAAHRRREAERVARAAVEAEAERARVEAAREVERSGARAEAAQIQARVEAEAELARASERIRAEAYARDAEQALLAANRSEGATPARLDAWPPPTTGQQPLQRRPALYDANLAADELLRTADHRRDRRGSAWQGPAGGATPGTGSIGTGSIGGAPGGPNGAGTGGITESSAILSGGVQPFDPAGAPVAIRSSDGTAAPVTDPNGEATRSRHEPFGPGTRSQAIIDLSARKRPRNPYNT